MTSTDPIAPDASRSRSELVAALPTVQRLAGELHLAVSRALETTPTTAEARAIDQAATAIIWAAKAVEPPNHAERIERLGEVANRAGYVINAAHEALAQHASIDELAGTECHVRQLGVGIGEAFVDGARLNVVLDEDGTTATVTLTVTSDGHVGWNSSDVALAPVDGEIQLAVTRALDHLAETITTALPEGA